MRRTLSFSWFALVFLVLGLVLSACGDDQPAPAPAQGQPQAAQPQPAAPVPATTQAATTAATTQATAAQPTPVPQPTAAPVQASLPRFEPASCPFHLGKGMTDGQNVKCGYLVVAQNHSQPQDKTVKLAVAIVQAKNAKPAATPIVYLEGGPGGAVEDTLYAFSDSLTEAQFPPKAMLKDHTMIFVDQRGVGYSVPALDCRENDELIYADLVNDLDIREQDRKDDDLPTREQAALDQCHSRLVNEGNNLDDFNTTEDAADINDLRIALGYDKLDLFGVSYGTQVAETALRDFPQSLRSVILDSTVPLQVDVYAQNALNYDHVLNLLFKTCAADAACNKAYPDLRGIFTRDVAKMNKEPALVPFEEPGTHKLYGVYMSGKSLVNLLFQSFYSNQYIQALPLILSRADQGDYEKLGQLFAYSVFGGGSFSDGMYYSVECSEQIAYSSPDDVVNASRNVMPEVRNIFVPSQQKIFKTCQRWPVKAAPASQNQAVSSDVPTLVLSGEFDPITPPAYGQLASKTLSKSFWFQFPGIGHGVTFSSSCGTAVALNFLQNPTAKPDTGCIAGMKTQFLIK